MASVEQELSSRVASERLGGAGLLVVDDGVEVERATFGTYSDHTVVPIASASKWLTAATMMTLVDEGRASLDDPVSKYLPEFTGTTGTATIRQLLSHTSGIAQNDCIWDVTTTLDRCVAKVANTKAAYAPGTRFSYGNTSYSVAGRVIEVVTGQSFETAFTDRIASPLHMTDTRFSGESYPRTDNPVPAASAESTLSDYGRFVAMLSADGVVDGRRILSHQSVREMEVDQVRGVDTRGDSAVRTTGIPTYGLGTWRDVVSDTDEGVITTGNGAYGFYPWVDRARNGYGVLLVFDQRGSDLAVPESQRTVHHVWDALAAERGAPKSPPTTRFGR